VRLDVVDLVRAPDELPAPRKDLFLRFMEIFFARIKIGDERFGAANVGVDFENVYKMFDL
jgi:hypothetical protein